MWPRSARFVSIGDEGSRHMWCLIIMSYHKVMCWQYNSYMGVGSVGPLYCPYVRDCYPM